MTVRRDGKGADESPYESSTAGGGGSRYFKILVTFQTLLIILILLKVFSIIPSAKTERAEAPISEEPFIADTAEVSSTVTEDTTVTPVQRKVRVEILNGSKAAGIARRAADLLVQKGYDVRDFRNADRSNYAKTMILVRNNDRAAGEALATIINLPLTNVKLEPDPNLVDVDITLLLGKDHARYNLR
jgi:uncharacterized lipoprotein NlpE involved in copper resistance